MLAFRDNTFGNPEGLIAYIREHPAGARVRPDMKVVFFDEWETPDERLKGATEILRSLVGDRGAGEGGVDRYHLSPPGIAVRRTASRSLSSGRPLRAGPVGSPMPVVHAAVRPHGLPDRSPAR